MIVDYKTLELDEIPTEGVLTVLEQIPGLVVIEDQTKYLLEKSYWKSYNLPFYPEIFELIGASGMVEKYGSYFSHEQTPRSLIIDRDHVKIKDFDTFMEVIRYNDFENDPLSTIENCSPSANSAATISSRFDINPISGPDCPFPNPPFRWP